MAETYLDHAATTPLRPAATAAMVDVLQGPAGNPSGPHAPARRARRRLDDARDLVAEAVGADPAEIVFTSGGTEADNLAITGAGALDDAGATVLAGATEHSAVREPLNRLGGESVPVDTDGLVDLDALRRRLRAAADGDDRPVRLVSIMAVNNETGARNDLRAIADLLAETHGAADRPLLHTDAVAAASWVELPELWSAVDLLSLSAHKVGGPQGSGALVARRGVPLRPLLVGGGQERELRSGTPGVAAAVGFATALQEAAQTVRVTVSRAETLRAQLVEGLTAIPDTIVLSPERAEHRSPGIVSVGVRGVDREALVFLLDRAGIAASWGSSCASGASETSPTLAAMGVAPELAAGVLRISFGWCSTGGDVDHLLSVLPTAIAELRKEMP